MASTEYDHCFNCLFFANNNFCSNHKKEVSKKAWCADQVRRNNFDANDIAVEYEIRRDHILFEMQGKKVRPIEDILKGMGWDGTERLKQGKWPEERIKDAN
jgi:hypothetical protein